MQHRRASGSDSIHLSILSLRERGERFSLFGNPSGKPDGGVAADVSYPVNDAVGGEKRLTGLDDHRRLTVKVVLPCSLNDVDDLLARMKVPGRR